MDQNKTKQTKEQIKDKNNKIIQNKNRKQKIKKTGSRSKTSGQAGRTRTATGDAATGCYRSFAEGAPIAKGSSRTGCKCEA